MVVIVLERVPASVRGELTRWLVEPTTGVFVGRISAAVRDRLWDLVCGKMKGGAGLLIHPSDSEQGYAVRFWGATSRLPSEFEGLTLFTIRQGAPGTPPLT